jgi:hypothetical protein
MLQIGTWLVWIPAAFWLSSQGENGWAIFVTVTGVIINILDNVIKPLLIGRGAGSPIWIIFIGVIGGVLTMGISASSSARWSWRSAIRSLRVGSEDKKSVPRCEFFRRERLRRFVRMGGRIP